MHLIRAQVCSIRTRPIRDRHRAKRAANGPRVRLRIFRKASRLLPAPKAPGLSAKPYELEISVRRASLLSQRLKPLALSHEMPHCAT